MDSKLYLKVQTEILKAAHKKADAVAINKWCFSVGNDPDYGDFHAVTNGLVVMFIPDDFYFLNDSAFSKNFNFGKLISQFNSNPIDYNFVGTHNYVGDTVLLFSTSEEPDDDVKNCLFIDEKLFKMFGSPDDFIFVADGKNSPLILLDKDSYALCGVILPVFH